MSVTRYNFDGDADGYFDDPFMKVQEQGKLVLHSDYATLLARHNALREAVTRMLGFLDGTHPEDMGDYHSARAEVDRLMGEGE